MKSGLAVLLHVKCRGGTYPRSDIQRFFIPDDKVDWTVSFNEYNPPYYNSPSIKDKPWADLDIVEPGFKANWNNLDGNINRVSYMGQYSIENGYPLNPNGRTGIAGRGVLGRWGPNHAADPVVTRWKRVENGDKVLHNSTNLPILQLVTIKRRDTGEWALPGGMVDPGEIVTETAIREFKEEATNSLLMNKEELEKWETKFNNFFKEGEEIYRGYVDDPRNTDNAWMETVAYNFHDESGTTVGKINLHAGDDAVGVRWLDIDTKLNLYASHRDIVQNVSKKLHCHW